MNSFFTGVLLIAAGGALSLLIKEKAKGWFFSLFAGAGTVFLVYPALLVLLKGEDFSARFLFFRLAGEIRLVLDPLSAFFVLLISVMSFLGTVYAAGYMKPYLGRKLPVGSHFLFLSLLIVSMLLVVVLRNALAFLIAWEIMSLSSFFLVTFENEKKEVFDAGINYLIMMHVGVVFLTAGFIFLSLKAGNYDFSSFKDAWSRAGIPADALFLLFFAGFGIKAGFVPLHTWLPRAHPAAPSHVSGLMSGLMIKTGIYGILRMITLMGAPSAGMGYFILAASAATALMGVLNAMAQRDVKKLLAYSSVENIGIIGMGIGTGLLGLRYGNPAAAALGFAGAMMHVLSHSVFKELLFYGAGSVYQKAHTRDIEKLGGLAKKMPWTSAFFLAASLAISGLPPFSGFIGEFLIYIGMFKGLRTQSAPFFVVNVLSISALACVGAMALLCFTRAFSAIFLGSPRSSQAENAVESGREMLLPMGALVLFTLLIGIFPQYAVRLVERPVMVFADTAGLSGVKSFAVLLSHVSRAGFLFFGVLLLLFLARHILLRGRKVRSFKTWDCGYQAGSVRMQYTASSFSAPLLELGRPVMSLGEREEKPEGLFPLKASYESHPEDVFEKRMISPASKGLERVMESFSWVQSGNTQHYILYGLIFLIIALLWILGGGK